MNLELNFKKQPKGLFTKVIHNHQRSTQRSEEVNNILKSDKDRLSIRNVVEKCLASLDNAKFGLTFSSGLGSLTTVLTLLMKGDHIILGDDVYAGTNILLRQIAKNFGIECSLADVTNLDEIRSQIRNNTKLVWIETPTNPTIKVADIESICALCHLTGDILVAIDNTFLTSYFQRPLELGADLVSYSLTKYMNGHADVVMGAITMNSENLYKRLKQLRETVGSFPSDFDCYQVNDGLKTLPLRMEQHQKNSIAIAKFLETQPFVEKVLHPALPSHPQHAIALKQSYGYSGVFSFYLKGNLENTKAFLNALQVFQFAESLGGCDSLVKLPSLMSHKMIPEEERQKLGINDSLLRLSVGVEDPEDLIDDLERALKCAEKI